MSSAVVLVAAGAGRRLGADGPKALVEVAGRPLLSHALERVQHSGPDSVVVVFTAGAVEDFRAVTERFDVDHLVPGGATRSESVRAGVATVPNDTDVVAIHDAARAFTPPSVMRAVLAAVRDGVIAAAPGLAVADTLKRVDGGEVLGTVPRQDLYAVQTPQAFRRDVLERVLAHVSGGATDDLALVERARDEGLVDGTIRLVPGSSWAAKMTYPEDLRLAELLAGSREE